MEMVRIVDGFGEKIKFVSTTHLFTLYRVCFHFTQHETHDVTIGGKNDIPDAVLQRPRFSRLFPGPSLSGGRGGGGGYRNFTFLGTFGGGLSQG